MSSASWCGPCKMLKAFFNQQNSVNKAASVEIPCLYIDIDDDDFGNFVEIYNISSIPSGLVLELKDGEGINSIMDIEHYLIDRVSGYNVEKYRKYINLQEKS
jgi:thiol-disulfide isomerase/thioredoxin